MGDHKPWQSIPDFANRVAQECLKQYSKLPKTGKPVVHETKAEWSVLACILSVYATSKDDHVIRVVSLGTGLKCLPYSKLVKDGQQVHDSHAEVIARRNFVHYVLDQAEKLIASDANKEQSPFQITSEGRLSVRPDYSFHMYISQSPCGDASMSALADMQTPESLEAFRAGSKRRSFTGVTDARDIFKDNMYSNKRQKLSSTPSIQGEQATPHGNGMLQRGRYGFEHVGALRTKPGRLDSDPTLCMSCSDKLARWNVVGLQSALLSHILDKPIYLESVIIGDMYDQLSLERALFGRIEKTLKGLPAPYVLHRPKALHTDVPFEFSKSTLESLGKYEALITSGTAISWRFGMQKPEVLVQGAKQGAPKNKPLGPKTRASICKLNIFQKFLSVLGSLRTLSDEEKSMTYHEWKTRAKPYQMAKTCLLDQCFISWLQTPDDYEGFVANQ